LALGVTGTTTRYASSKLALAMRSKLWDIGKAANIIDSVGFRWLLDSLLATEEEDWTTKDSRNPAFSFR
jgi:hypothetical protein